jgi:hypothetical protein
MESVPFKKIKAMADLARQTLAGRVGAGLDHGAAIVQPHQRSTEFLSGTALASALT